MGFYGLPVIMLAEFSSKSGKVPMPRKFKFQDRSGVYHTISIDKIIEVHTQAIGFAMYDCISIAETHTKVMQLKYTYKTHCWELCTMHSEENDMLGI